MQPPSWQQETPCFPIVKPSSSPILSQSETPVSSPHKLLLILGAFSVPNYPFSFFETFQSTNHHPSFAFPGNSSP
jgi:hypothetical protein